MDTVIGETLVILTNNFEIKALVAAKEIQGSLADRTGLQIDQAAPADQSLMRPQREQNTFPPNPATGKKAHRNRGAPCTNSSSLRSDNAC
jgi:hypothetical protein